MENTLSDSMQSTVEQSAEGIQSETEDPLCREESTINGREGERLRKCCNVLQTSAFQLEDEFQNCPFFPQPSDKQETDGGGHQDEAESTQELHMSHTNETVSTVLVISATKQALFGTLS